MAKQIGPNKFQGRIDNQVFYKSQDGFLVKGKGGASADRIANDPSFARTRENYSEFSAASRASKFLNNTVRWLRHSASDNRLSARMTQQMTRIKKLDAASVRGKRTVDTAIALPAAKAILKGFNFNVHAIFNSMMSVALTLDASSGAITINNFAPADHLTFPPGATHLQLTGAFAKVNFVTGDGAVEVSDKVTLPLEGTSTSLILTPAKIPAGTGTSIYLLKVVYLQLINGVEYELKDKTSNSLEIIEVL